ncbi:MAG: stress response translation initiation inhibitor YciH [Planctomycetes bacterium]|nr:stress response translation initiation inhibitor YciH [Planctomycetota bacterium]
MKPRSDQNSRLVYSSDTGAVPKPVESRSTEEFDGVVRIRRETKGRGGKTVTVVWGLGWPTNELKALAKSLKKRCGSGGSVVEDRIEIQGDHADVIERTLAAQGLRVRRSGA